MASAVATTADRSAAPQEATAARTSPWPFVVAAAHLPLLVAYYAGLWSLPHYQFFPLAFAGAYLLARRDRPFAASQSAATNRRGAVLLLVLGLMLLAAAVALDSPWLSVPAALTCSAAWAVERGGMPALRRLVPAALMVLITLRPPMGFDNRLILLLQQVTARSASALLDVLGVVHALSGNVIEIPGRRLMVEEACSGVNSFFSAAACALFFVLWHRRGWISSLLLFASIPFWVVVANTLRVVTVTVLRSRWDVAADEGWLHDALGLAVFLVAVGFIVSTERLIRFYAALPEKEPPLPAAVAETVSPASPPSFAPGGSRRWKFAGICAVVLCLLQVPSLTARVRDVAGERLAPPQAELGEAWVPETLGPWKRAKYETVERDRTSPFGKHSQTWSLAGAQSRAAVSFDYPFHGWHELTECYTGQGWRIERRSVFAVPNLAGANDTAGEATAVETDLRHDQSTRHGKLFFALLTSDGAPYAARTRGELDEWIDRAADRWRNIATFGGAAFAPAADDRTTYQIQLFIDSYAPLDESAAAEARQAFLDVYRRAAWELRRPK